MIDRLLEDDAAAAAGLSASFGWAHRVEDWALFLRLGHGVAWREGGTLAGTAMWFPLGEGHATIGLVQVAAALQGKGIGRQLMRAVMAEAEPRALALHATAEGAALYGSLGFVPVGVIEQWQGVFVPPAARSGEVRAATDADRAAILQLDREATGLDRSRQLEAWFADAVIAVADDGYAARHQFGRGPLVGPVIAGSPSKAIALAAHLAEPGFLRLDVPAEAEALKDWMGAHGLALVEPVQRMVRGRWPETRRWGLMTQALG